MSLVPRPRTAATPEKNGAQNEIIVNARFVLYRAPCDAITLLDVSCNNGPMKRARAGTIWHHVV